MKSYSDFLNEIKKVYVLGSSSIHGEGIFADKDISKGSCVGITHHGYPDKIKCTEN